jgi:hypothetical protein
VDENRQRNRNGELRRLGQILQRRWQCARSGLRLAIDKAKKAANISREIAINEVADFTVLPEAQRE